MMMLMLKNLMTRKRKKLMIKRKKIQIKKMYIMRQRVGRLSK